jgi:excisionase family DNA binding protein
MTQPLAETALRVDEAARRLGISRRLLYRLAARGEIRLTKLGGCTRVRASEVQRLLDRCTR